MAKIQRMDAHLTNMIAAGEVVERPAGVVKELVENCIDAGATNIEIHIKQGGLEEMNIIDDGCGMSASDACMAFERHATSKIHEMSDLWKISTMGFRGEALPSIASVAQVVLNTNDGSDSTKVEIAYGKMIKAQPFGCRKGTQIIVRNLFQKTPARLKHLKTPQYEFSLISDIIQKFALSRSDISFTLTHDEKEVFSTKGKGNTLEVLMAMYGRDCAKLAIPLDASDDDYRIKGYAIQPSMNRASKYYMLVYINHRMIRSYRIHKAILDAYKKYLPSDRYPITVLEIEMDPKLVDVNVHPSKWEVRLSKEKQLETFIYQTISEALNTKLEVNKVERVEKVKVAMPQFDFTYANTTIKEVENEIREEFKEYAKEESIIDKKEEVIKQRPVETVIVEPKIEEITYENEENIEASSGENQIKKPIEMAINPSFPQMQVLAQLHGCYILAQGEKGLYIIDQHAAQERYHYEVISNMIMNGERRTQPLLIPLTIESTISAVAQIEDINTLLNEIGITLEAFGNNSFIVRELPIWVFDVEEKKFILDMIEFYLKNREIGIQQLRKHAIATMACHSSIRFNRNLTLEEMNKVVEDLRKCEQPFHCPHGRPTFIEMTLKELEKEFYRVK